MSISSSTSASSSSTPCPSPPSTPLPSLSPALSQPSSSNDESWLQNVTYVEPLKKAVWALCSMYCIPVSPSQYWNPGPESRTSKELIQAMLCHHLPHSSLSGNWVSALGTHVLSYISFRFPQQPARPPSMSGPTPKQTLPPSTVHKYGYRGIVFRSVVHDTSALKQALFDVTHQEFVPLTVSQIEAISQSSEFVNSRQQAMAACHQGFAVKKDSIQQTRTRKRKHQSLAPLLEASSTTPVSPG